MNNNVLDVHQVLNLNPYDYLINQYYWNVVNRNILRGVLNSNNDNIMNNLEINNINIVLNTMNMVINNIGAVLNNNPNELDNNQHQQLLVINHLRDM